VNQREAARRQRVIAETLAGLREIFTTNLHQEMDLRQELEMETLLRLGAHKMELEP
jgi:hypothetical protein